MDNEDDFEKLLQSYSQSEIKNNQIPPPLSTEFDECSRQVEKREGCEDDFMVKLNSFNQKRPLQIVAPTNLPTFELFEKKQNEINNNHLIADQKKSAVEDAKIEAENINTRKIIEEENQKRFTSFDESTGWYDQTALETASRLLVNINKVDSKTRKYIKAVYGIESNILGYFDSTKLMIAFKSPISKIKLYIELLENGLPVK